jgi:hypothetical protein
VVPEAGIRKEINDLFKNMNSEMEREFRGFEIDPVIKNVHLSMKDTEYFRKMFIQFQDDLWLQDPFTLDYVITFLRQYKSAVNIIKKLKQLENIECKFILNLAVEVREEYSKNLEPRLRRKFWDWYGQTLSGFCD